MDNTKSVQFNAADFQQNEKLEELIYIENSSNTILKNVTIEKIYRDYMQVHGELWRGGRRVFDGTGGLTKYPLFKNIIFITRALDKAPKKPVKSATKKGTWKVRKPDNVVSWSRQGSSSKTAILDEWSWAPWAASTGIFKMNNEEYKQGQIIDIENQHADWMAKMEISYTTPDALFVFPISKDGVKYFYHEGIPRSQIHVCDGKTIIRKPPPPPKSATKTGAPTKPPKSVTKTEAPTKPPKSAAKKGFFNMQGGERVHKEQLERDFNEDDFRVGEVLELLDVAGQGPRWKVKVCTTRYGALEIYVPMFAHPLFIPYANIREVIFKQPLLKKKPKNAAKKGGRKKKRRSPSPRRVKAAQKIQNYIRRKKSPKKKGGRKKKRRSPSPRRVKAAQKIQNYIRRKKSPKKKGGRKKKRRSPSPRRVKATKKIQNYIRRKKSPKKKGGTKKPKSPRKSSKKKFKMHKPGPKPGDKVVILQWNVRSHWPVGGRAIMTEGKIKKITQKYMLLEVHKKHPFLLIPEEFQEKADAVKIGDLVRETITATERAPAGGRAIGKKIDDRYAAQAFLILNDKKRLKTLPNIFTSLGSAPPIEQISLDKINVIELKKRKPPKSATKNAAKKVVKSATKKGFNMQGNGDVTITREHMDGKPFTRDFFNVGRRVKITFKSFIAGAPARSQTGIVEFVKPQELVFSPTRSSAPIKYRDIESITYLPKKSPKSANKR